MSSKNPIAVSDFKDPFSVQYYVVSLLDILSQRSELAKWGVLPHDQPPEFTEALKHTIGTVAQLRLYFSNMVGQLKDVSIPESALSELSPEQRVQLINLVTFDFETHFFSDTLIGYSKLRVVDGISPLKEVFCVLGAAGMTVLAGLASRVAIRGAVDVGAGTDAFPGECYGPGLASVYQLEQHLAEYPRVVVGRNLQKLLKDLSLLPPAGLNVITINMAKYIRTSLFVDEDGAVAFDALGTVMRNVMPTFGMAIVVEKARAFARDEHKRFVMAGNHKLALRYARLVRYFDRRSEPWPFIRPQRASSYQPPRRQR